MPKSISTSHIILEIQQTRISTLNVQQTTAYNMLMLLDCFDDPDHSLVFTVSGAVSLMLHCQFEALMRGTAIAFSSSRSTLTAIWWLNFMRLHILK
jgi:hypothetical protein